MTRMLNACTLEVDEAEVALRELLAQLRLEEQGCANTVGFITCSYDFIEAGTLEEICAGLPFDIVGCTTLTNAVNNEAGTMMLCLSVLTSDEWHFSTVLSSPLDEERLEHTVRQAYNTAAAALPGKPGFVLAFAPMIRALGGEFILNALDTVAEGTPVFGTIACDMDVSQYENSFTFCNGQATRNCLALLLVSGESLSPRFFVAVASKDRIQKQKAIITESEGCVLKKVNGVTAKEYLSSLGLIIGGGIEGLSAMPFIVNYNDGTPPVARAIYMLTNEDYAVCGGAMPKGATLSIGVLDPEDVLASARSTTESIMGEEGAHGIILFPCLGRNLVLGTNNLAEVEKVQQAVGDTLPYHLAYSGGEICPVYNEEGTPRNRFHNFTFIACVI